MADPLSVNQGQEIQFRQPVAGEGPGQGKAAVEKHVGAHICIGGGAGHGEVASNPVAGLRPGQETQHLARNEQETEEVREAAGRERRTSSPKEVYNLIRGRTTQNLPGQVETHLLLQHRETQQEFEDKIPGSESV